MWCLSSWSYTRKAQGCLYIAETGREAWVGDMLLMASNATPR